MIRRRHNPVRSLVLLMAVLMPAALSAGSASELLASGRVDEAIQRLSSEASGGAAGGAAGGVTGNKAATFNQLCRAYYEIGEWDNAVHNCERAVQLEPRNAEFQMWMGRSYGQKAEAAAFIDAYSLAKRSVTAFSTAHMLDPKSAEIASDLGEYYATAPAIAGGGSARALAYANEIQPLHPAVAAWVRAMVAANGGDYDKAEREFANYIRMDTGSARPMLEYARYLRGRKQWQRFQQTVEQAAGSSRILRSEHYDVAEMLLKSNRNLPLAAQQIRTYIQSGHSETMAPLFRAHYMLGEILRKSGDKTQAAAEYRAALALAAGYHPAAEALARLGQRP